MSADVPYHRSGPRRWRTDTARSPWLLGGTPFDESALPCMCRRGTPDPSSSLALLPRGHLVLAFPSPRFCSIH